MNKKYIIITILASLITSCTNRNNFVDNGNWIKLDEDIKHKFYHRINDTIIIGLIKPWEYNYNLIRMHEVDIATFEVCEGSGYARDCNHVYFPILQRCYDDAPFDGIFVEYYLTEADPKTFKYIGNEYGADKRNMFHWGTKIDWDNEIINSKGMRTSHKCEVDTIPIVED